MSGRLVRVISAFASVAGSAAASLEELALIAAGE
jgi:hypothetical protein